MGHFYAAVVLSKNFAKKRDRIKGSSNSVVLNIVHFFLTIEWQKDMLQRYWICTTVTPSGWPSLRSH